MRSTATICPLRIYTGREMVGIDTEQVPDDSYTCVCVCSNVHIQLK